jgi:hypothetical protein
LQRQGKHAGIAAIKPRFGLKLSWGDTGEKPKRATGNRTQFGIKKIIIVRKSPSVGNQFLGEILFREGNRTMRGICVEADDIAWSAQGMKALQFISEADNTAGSQGLVIEGTRRDGLRVPAALRSVDRAPGDQVRQRARRER